MRKTFPETAMIRKFALICGRVVFLRVVGAVFLAAFPSAPALADYTWEGVPSGYGLAWSDEFNGTLGSAPNSANWNYDTGATGWGNNELEDYTNSTQNSQIVSDPSATDGKALGIIQIDTNPTGTNYSTVGRYTSARLLTLGKQAFPYSYIVARIHLPYGQGIWPAFWMMGNDINSVNWPACGEIDTMENIGKASDQPICHGSLHDGPVYTNEVNWGSTFTLPGGQLFHTAYHTFATLRVQNQVQYFVDGNLYETVNASSQAAGTSWAFNDTSHQFFILLNTAVGGGWPGNPDATTSFPQTMLVDYVRVYEPGVATPTPVVQSTWRVRCGGDTYVDSQGNTWVADTNFTGGSPGATGNTVSGTVLPSAGDSTLYQYERVGGTAGGETVTYTFNVPSGSNYQVTVKFMENYWTAAGQRKFNVSINGTTALSQFDILATAGGQNKALDEVFNNITPTAGGQIVLQFSQGAADNPKVDAIQIVPMTVSGSATPTVSATSTATPSSTASASPSDTFTSTPSGTATLTPSATGSMTPTRTVTPNMTASQTPTNTLMVKPSSTPTGTPTQTGTNTVTATNSMTASATAQSTPTASFTASWTPSLTASYTATSTATLTQTPTLTLVSPASFTPSPTPSSTQINPPPPCPYCGAIDTISIPTRTYTPDPILMIYPNPSSGGIVNILPPAYGGVSDVRIRVFTVSFRKVLDKTFAQVPSGIPVQINVDGLASGLYYVVIDTGRTRSVAKLIVLW